ncbi:hypothetical protein [Candidatus Desulforudis audaxviator]|nr:hypothetical protein [Candidatus Desulforudis audaxviator]
MTRAMKDGTNNWAVSKVYLHLVALITFSVLLFNFVELVRAIPDYIAPLPGWTMDHQTARNELFLQKYGQYPDLSRKEHRDKMAAFTKEEVEALMEERYQAEKERIKAYNLRTIIRHGVSFIILLPVHIYFFRLARKSEYSNPNP